MKASELIKIAKAEIGYKEKASNSQLDDKTANAGSANYTKYARDLKNAGYYNGNKNGYAWCDVFVDWCFYMAAGKDAKEAQRVECQTGDCGAGCTYSKRYYSAQGRCDKNPKVGDQVFFTSNGSISHTGIVYEVSGSTIKTIEGNSSDQVSTRSYSLSNSYVDSFGHPWYEEETATEPVISTTKTDEETIWDFLKKKLGNAYGAAGLMGNLYAESALRANNLQNSYETKLGMTDTEYTAAVDNGTYDNFIKDSAGYGLAQWTYWSRKENLLNFAKAAGKSIGDLGMQLDFLWQELSGYTSLLKTLKNATSVEEASTAVLTIYEKPADQSDAVKKKRAGYGQTYYDKYVGKTSGDTTGTTTTTKTETQTTTAIKAGDLVKITGSTYYNGKKIPAWVKKLNWYVHSVSGDRAVIDKDENGKHSIMSPVKTTDLTIISAVATTSAAGSTVNTYTVVKGDCLWNIAKQYLGSGSRYKEIKELNGLMYDTIYVGQVLKIPEK